MRVFLLTNYRSIRTILRENKLKMTELFKHQLVICFRGKNFVSFYRLPHGNEKPLNHQSY
jgi:hypothetical protein